MTDPIALICMLTGCTEEDANRVFNETEDVIDAIDRILEKKPSAINEYIESKKRPRQVTPEEKIVGSFREKLKELDNLISTALYRPLREELAEMRGRHGETVLQNNYSQECLPPSPQSKVEIQETACLSQSECSCDLQSRGQIPPCSDLRCLQSCQDQEKGL